MAETGDLLAAWAARAADEDAAWATARPGPALAAVAARLSGIPRPFLDERVSVRALAGDVFGDAPAGVAGTLACLDRTDDPRVRLGASIALWLVASEEVVAPFEPPLAAVGTVALGSAVDALALRLAPIVDPLDWIADDERREEAVRTFLLWSGCLPAGEDAATARALLAARDSLARNRALSEAYAEQRHRAEIARRLADARAKEAAARYSAE